MAVILIARPKYCPFSRPHRTAQMLSIAETSTRYVAMLPQELAWHSTCTVLLAPMYHPLYGSTPMPKLVRIVIQLPQDLKHKLDALKLQGYTASGFIRAVLEREFAKAEDKDADNRDGHRTRQG